jgi:hypothetical protein
VDDPEGILVSRAEKANELLVRAQSEKWGGKPDSTASSPSRGMDGRSFHVNQRL